MGGFYMEKYDSDIFKISKDEERAKDLLEIKSFSVKKRLCFMHTILYK